MFNERAQKQQLVLSDDKNVRVVGLGKTVLYKRLLQSDEMQRSATLYICGPA